MEFKGLDEDPYNRIRAGDVNWLGETYYKKKYTNDGSFKWVPTNEKNWQQFPHMNVILYVACQTNQANVINFILPHIITQSQFQINWGIEYAIELARCKNNLECVNQIHQFILNHSGRL